ncbi:MAG: hypothetical protein IPL40_16450 [Proteobacteria bacterium]|nr:hypothetical protein [Pseudomonadota bacterium]
MIAVKPPLRTPTTLALLVVALAGVVALVACEGSRWSAAKRSGTVAAYRAFLARHPAGGHAAEAARGLERATYRAARRADRPLGYRQYLDRFPGGRFAVAARERLGQLALRRARSLADFELVVERYEQTPAGRVAAARLVSLAARRALRTGSPGALRAFLARYSAQQPWTARVREALAGAAYAQLADDPLQLLAFVRQHPGTAWAARADQRLGAALARAVETRADATAVAILATRFPDDPRLPALRRLVWEREREQALIALDLRRLRVLARAGPREQAGEPIVKWCDAHPSACRKLGDLATAAGPWRPEGGPGAWRRAREHADPLRLWAAAEALGWSEDPLAGEGLAALLASTRLVEVWPAVEALRHWLGRRAAGDRARWLRPRLVAPEGNAAAAPDAAPAEAVAGEPEREQGAAVLALLGGGAAQRSLALRALRRRAEQGAHALAASFLLLCALEPRLATASDLQRFRRAAAARLDQLAQVFPADLVPEAESAATLVERELFVIERGLALAAPALADASKSAADDPDPLRRRANALLAEWRVQLGRAYPGFQPAERPSSAATVAEHEAGRHAALRVLLRERGPAAAAVAQAICAAAARRVAEVEGGETMRAEAAALLQSRRAVEGSLAAACRRAGR